VKQLGSIRRSNACRASSGQCSRSSTGVRMFVGVAQPVELQFCKLEVRGSSPLASSTAVRRFERVPVIATSARIGRCQISEGCPSGQREQAVNLPANAYGGSIPPPSTRWVAGSGIGCRASRHWRWRSRRDGAIGRVPAAGVAQLVERQPSKLNVVGSNPISRSQQFCWRSPSNEEKSAEQQRPPT
jgi:hypothetical protein